MVDSWDGKNRTEQETEKEVYDWYLQVKDWKSKSKNIEKISLEYDTQTEDCGNWMRNVQETCKYHFFPDENIKASYELYMG